MCTALGVDGSISSRSRFLRWLGWRLNRCCGYIGVIVAGYGWLDNDSSSSTWGIDSGCFAGDSCDGGGNTGTRSSDFGNGDAGCDSVDILSNRSDLTA